MKVLCIIQARMGSERLPGKVMKDVLGKPMITYTLERAKKSRYIDQVVLATSTKPTEDTMVEYLTAQGYEVFCGDENNVLERFVQAHEKYGGDIIVRLTGDCPFIDPVIIDQVITYFMANNLDYARADVPGTFIRGFDVEVFSKEAMLRAYESVKDTKGQSPDKEHVTYYMYTHSDDFRISYFHGSELYCRDYRLCVDTREDFELINTIYNHFQTIEVTAKEIIAYLDEHPEIAGINAEIKQKHV